MESDASAMMDTVFSDAATSSVLVVSTIRVRLGCQLDELDEELDTEVLGMFANDEEALATSFEASSSSL